MAKEKDDDMEHVLHTVKVRLYENHLKGGDGTYIAKTINERTLYTPDIIKAMKTRGNYPWDKQTAKDIIERYNAEKAYQLCDGFAVSDGFIKTYPRISGTFESPRAEIDPTAHKISFRHTSLGKMRELIKNVQIVMEQNIAVVTGFIDYLDDQMAPLLEHNVYEPGHIFAIYGRKIKIEGDEPDIGVYFVPVDDPSQKVKLVDLAENKPGKITGIAPNTLYSRNRIEIRTRFSGNKKPLQETRVITSKFIIEAM